MKLILVLMVKSCLLLTCNTKLSLVLMMETCFYWLVNM